MGRGEPGRVGAGVVRGVRPAARHHQGGGARRLADIVPINGQSVEHQQPLADRLTEDKVLPGEVAFNDIVTQGLIEGGG